MREAPSKTKNGGRQEGTWPAGRDMGKGPKMFKPWGGSPSDHDTKERTKRRQWL